MSTYRGMSASPRGSGVAMPYGAAGSSSSPSLAQHHHHGSADDSARVVSVNVGGQRFATQLGTLRVHRSSVLAALFTPPYAIHQDPTDGSFFLDRNGEVFGLVLDYLRTGTLVVPRDPVLYAILRREVSFYGLPIAAQLPPSQPLSWEPAPVRYKHARVTLDEVEKTVEWEEGALPADLHTRQIFEIVSFFTHRGYKVASEYTSRGSRGFASIWLVKKERYPGADVAPEVSAADPPYAQARRLDIQPAAYAAPPPPAHASVGLSGGGGRPAVLAGGEPLRSTSAAPTPPAGPGGPSPGQPSLEGTTSGGATSFGAKLPLKIPMKAMSQPPPPAAAPTFSQAPSGGPW
jgi:hypothetical protein